MDGFKSVNYFDDVFGHSEGEVFEIHFEVDDGFGFGVDVGGGGVFEFGFGSEGGSFGGRSVDVGVLRLHGWNKKI